MNDKLFEKFTSDLDEAKKAENIVMLALRSKLKGTGTSFENVAADSRFYYMGDIEVKYGKGKRQYIDVKDDGLFHRTGNLNAEHETQKPGHDRRDGFMKHAKYDVVAYHSREEKFFYLVDFKKWQKVYKSVPSSTGRGGMITKRHKNGEVTYSFLNSVERLKELGVIMKKIAYDYSGSYENPDEVWVTGIVSYDKVKNDEAA